MIKYITLAHSLFGIEVCKIQIFLLNFYDDTVFNVNIIHPTINISNICKYSNC